MEKKFDLIVIGTGAGGSAAAYKCRKAGWDVAIIDSNPFGGTCALRGCDPKKVLVGAAEVVDWNRRMEGNGVFSAGVEIDWQALMQFKRTFTDPVPGNNEKGFAKAGIVAFQGRAAFTDKTTLKIGEDVLSGRFVLIAAGAKPAKLGIPGEEHLTTSTEFLELSELPRRIAFVGGGYIAFEFVHIAARAGAQVQILHRGERPLAGFDPDLVEILVQATRDLGVDLRLKTSVTSVEKDGKHFIVKTSAEDSSQTFEADMVVHSAGRVPDIDDMNLEKADVEREKKGIVVNEYLQSVSSPRVYAAGDATAGDGLPLTPVATMEGHVAASNMLNGNRRNPNYTGTSTVVFTVPRIASVGLGEEEAKQRGLQFKIKFEETSGWYSSKRMGIKYSGFKTLVDEESGQILGAHLLGPHADEVINIFAIAIRHKLTASDLKTMIYSYPTSTSDISYMV